MSTSLQVNVFLYPHVINTGPLNEDQIADEAEKITGNLGSSHLFRTFLVNPVLFEQFNFQYSEKQVTRIDDNFFYYSLGTRFRIQSPSQSPPRRIRYLIRKSFSGDVSGDIGEALFAYFMIQEMGVHNDRLGHTRPEKKRNLLTPDFVVLERTSALSALLQTSNYPLPILAEVKGFTGFVDRTRVSHALGQLQALGSNPSLFGMAFLATRNESRRGYDAYVVRVKT
jgi:hypothetical protein